MAQHTPGPWSRTVSRNQAATYTRVGAGDYGAIAECAGMQPNPEENAANARLIAAAPALLDCLRDMVCTRCETTDGTAHPWCDRARQVIAQATAA